MKSNFISVLYKIVIFIICFCLICLYKKRMSKSIKKGNLKLASADPNTLFRESVCTEVYRPDFRSP